MTQQNSAQSESKNLGDFLFKGWIEGIYGQTAFVTVDHGGKLYTSEVEAQWLADQGIHEGDGFSCYYKDNELVVVKSPIRSEEEERKIQEQLKADLAAITGDWLHVDNAS